MEFRTPKSKLVSIQVSDLVSTNFLCMFALNIPSRLQLRSCTLSALSAGKFNGLGVETQVGIRLGGPMGFPRAVSNHVVGIRRLPSSIPDTLGGESVRRGGHLANDPLRWINGQRAFAGSFVRQQKWEDAVSRFSRVWSWRQALDFMGLAQQFESHHDCQGWMGHAILPQYGIRIIALAMFTKTLGES